MRARPALILGLFALAAIGATCKGNGSRTETAPPPKPEPEVEVEEEAAAPVADLEGVDLSLVRPELRADVVRLFNETFCYCGCPRTVAACLSARADCSCVRCSDRMAKFILDQYANGLSTEEVELELLDGFSEGFNGTQRNFDLSDHPSHGNPNAKIVLVEFADFRCSHCKAAVAPLEQLINSRDDVRLVFFYYPLGAAVDGPNFLAAEAAEEARQQGKFWEMYQILFRYQHALEEENLAKYAAEIGLDVERFKNALAKRIHQGRVLADKKIGQAANVEATPAIFYNGRPFGLGRTYENLKLRLDMEQERGRCD